MAYLTEDNFREGKALWRDIILPGSVDSTLITDEIAGASEFIDRMCRDHFEQVASVTLTFYGAGHDMLFTPGFRLSEVGGTVDYFAVDGASSVEVTAYNLHAWGLERRDGLRWDVSRKVVINDVTYGWSATPYKIKRAVALLVHDALSGAGAGKHRVTRWNTGEAEFEVDPTSQTGLPEVDAIVKQYRVPNLGLGF